MEMFSSSKLLILVIDIVVGTSVVVVNIVILSLTYFLEA